MNQKQRKIVARVIVIILALAMILGVAAPLFQY